jgi:ABC-type sugar transport system ATPase subunit
VQTSGEARREPLLETAGLTKHYGPTFAAEDVAVRLYAGSVHALVGENGAGKSTLIKMLTGLVRPTRGEIRYGGRRVEIRSPHQAMADGIVAVHQELTLVETLSVAENVWLGHEPRTRFGRVDFGELVRRSRALVEEVGLDVDPSGPVGRLPLAKKQLVEFLKALSWAPRVLILDEATSSLGDVEVSLLEKTVARLKADGCAIAFVSHRMPEIFRFCDFCSVMKDGRIVHEDEVARMDEGLIVAKMTGRQAKHQLFPARPEVGPGVGSAPLLAVRNLSTRGGLRDVSFELHRGEILGLGGLQGHGQVELLECLFGLRRVTAGTISLGDVPLRLRRPPDAIRAGIVFVPEDRKTQGLFLEHDVQENLVACSHRMVSFLGFLRRSRVRQITQQVISEMAIKVERLSALVKSLSGGNQQKVALGRWLRSRSQVVVLVEPTRGIDINTKVEIYRLLRRLADSGLGVVLTTNENLELVGLCDRVIVLFEKTIAAELRGEELTEHNIVAASFGYAKGRAS